MKSFIITLALMIFILGGLSQAADFKITKVIEVDDVSFVPMLGPIKWSPEGTNLAYFKGKQLYFTDTLGNSEFIYEFKIHPHRYEWISEHQLVFQFVNHLGHGSSAYQLVTFDLNTNQETILSEYVYERGYKSVNGNVSFWGPFLTIEGNAYYETHTYTGDESNTSKLDIKYFDSDLKNSSKNHILHWENSKNIILIDINTLDSVLLVKKPGWKGSKAIINMKDSLIFCSQYLIDLTDNQIITNIEQLHNPLPPSIVGCGYLYPSFNPIYPEIIFHQSCDSTDKIVLERVLIFDFHTNKILSLDSMLNLENCTAPAFHPEGRTISLISKGKLYIVNRE